MADELRQIFNGRGSVILWQRHNTLCTSGFVYDVVLHTTGPMARKRQEDSVTIDSNQISLNDKDGAKSALYGCLSLAILERCS